MLSVTPLAVHQWGKATAFKNEKTKKEQLTVDERLCHIAFIMDGNGRWAKKRGMPREFGHKKGAETFKKIMEYCGEIGLKAATFYVFPQKIGSAPKKR